LGKREAALWPGTMLCLLDEEILERYYRMFDNEVSNVLVCRRFLPQVGSWISKEIDTTEKISSARQEKASHLYSLFSPT
jgi:hypothetical protein